ncbi:FeoA family protein [Saccharibacillus alkalitolerans]|uniref:Ferrous iron transport protein A n=1 Tax=Saccharibacillus alkalitolerans TaxID=2705290 RepID=A0ABX0F618_9BACL|nr:FeoA family protein [Saccharibacillus alkalitolerans]NGZ75905.1 ferrous iron transport protein A [Saccharibacillus alkalitolerans]
MFRQQAVEGRRQALASVKPGDSAEVRGLNGISPMLRRRLRDLGVAEGSVLTVLRLGPFGGPLTFECAGQHIGIRREEAGRMEVAPL